MARVRVESARLRNWEDVDQALKVMGEHYRSITKIEADMNEKMNMIKSKCDEKATPHKEQIKTLEVQIKEFVEDNREDLGNKKSKELNFGKTGFRKSTKISLPRAAAKLEEVISKLKVFGMHDCVVQPAEKVDKEALKKYPPNDVVKVGAGLKVEDTFWYEVNEEKLAE